MRSIIWSFCAIGWVALLVNTPSAEAGALKLIRLADGSGDVWVAKSALRDGDLAGAQVVARLGRMSLEGVVSQGSYDSKAGLIDFEGTLELLEPFTYRAGNVTTRLKPGGTVQVEVEASQFKSADLDNVAADMAVDLSGGDDPLELNGTLKGGTYEPGAGITFNARLEVTEDFVYEKGPVKATLGGGGTVQVDVQANDLKEVTFGGLEIQVDVTVPGTSEKLGLRGSITDGKYEMGSGVVLEGALVDALQLEYDLGLKIQDVPDQPTLLVELVGPVRDLVIALYEDDC